MNREMLVRQLVSMEDTYLLHMYNIVYFRYLICDGSGSELSVLLSAMREALNRQMEVL